VPSPHKALLALGLAIAIWVVAVAPRGLYSGDSGVKLAQTYALWSSGFTTRALPAHPELDPAGDFMAYGEFKRRVDGEWQGIYSLSFTALSAPMLGAFGMAGLPILPLLGTLLVLAGTFALARRIGCAPWWAVAISAVTVFATPVLLYSSQLTEHTLATGLVTWALALVVPDRETASPRRDLVAGVLVGFAATVRPECYLAIAAIGIASIVPPWTSRSVAIQRGALYAAGALAMLVPYWLLNLRLSGTWDPLVTFQEGAAASWTTLGLFLVGATRAPVTGIYIAFALCLVSGALPASWLRRLHVQLATTLLLAVVVGLSIMVALKSWHGTTGLFHVTPLAIVGLWAGGRSSAARRLWIGTALLLVAVLVLNRSNDAGGLQLGSRILMPVLPALLCLGGAHLQALRAERPTLALRYAHLIAIAGLAVLTAIAMARGMPESHSIVRNNDGAVEVATRAGPRVVVTTVWWQSQVLAPVLLDGKVLLLARDAAQLQRLIEQLRERGVSDFLLIEQGRPSPAPPGTELAPDGQTRLPFGGEGMMYLRTMRIARAAP